MTTLFIADLHLEESRPDISDIFFRFLKEMAHSAKALYILGDLFEVWIGDDDQSAFNRSIIKALKATAEAGTALYFMPGNRDFLIGKAFRKASGCQALPDEQVILLQGQPTLLMHGDTLCTRDIDYLKFRKLTRRFLVQKYFLFKSLEKRQALAQKARAKSQQHTQTTESYIMDVTTDEVERVMLKQGVQHLIHGHTHRPAVHQFELKGQAATRTVLAPWHEEGSVLFCDEREGQEFIRLR